MNKLAEELNSVLAGTVAYRLLSDFGKRFFFPKGIVYQAAEAGKLAHRFNATVGMAYHHGNPLALPSVSRLVPGLSTTESVSYAPTQGIESLRKTWLSAMIQKNPSLNGKSVSVPVVVPGLTNGVAQTIDLFINPEDTVIIPDLHWDNYPLIIEGRIEARVRTFPFFTDEGGFNISGMIAALHEHQTNGKAVLLLNFPNNPSGYAPGIAEAQAIRKNLMDLADSGVDILVISDDAYFGLFYEPDTFTESLFSLLADAHERILAVKVDGPTKEDYVWGFRTGFITFGARGLTGAHYEALCSKLMGSIRSSVSSSSRLGQSILIRAMQDPEYQHEKEMCFTLLKERYTTVKSVLAHMPVSCGLTPLPFNSGYFMSFRVDGSAESLRQELLNVHGVGTIAISDHILRVAYASIDTEGIPEMYGIIFRTAEELNNRKR